MTYPTSELRVVPEAAQVRVTATGDLSHLCPHFDEEDHGAVEITWTCRGHSIELHSLKKYLDAFEESSVSHETLTQRIATDLASLTGITDVSVVSRWDTAGFAVTVAG